MEHLTETMYGSSLENIQNQDLRNLIGDAIKNASTTIENDLLDAFSDSKSDSELVENWRGKLIGLKNEVEHYLRELEKMKDIKCPK